MPKIIFIHLYNDRSGSPKVLSDVINAYRTNAENYEVITSANANGFLTPYETSSNVLFYKRSENKALTLLYFFISQIHLFFLCLRYRKQNVIFYVNTMMPFSAGIAGRLLGKKVIFHVHETSLKPKLLKIFLRYVIEKTATKVIFVSKYLSEAERFIKPEQSVIYNAIENQALNKDEQIQQVNNQNFKILMVCSLKEYKGVKEFISLSRKLSGMNFILVLNADKLEIDAIFHDWKIQLPSNILIYPRQSNLVEFYLDSSVVLNLSRPDVWVETFGLTVVEAMSFSKPVIVPPVGGPAEIVRNGIEGYCISCYELEAIKEKLVSLSHNKELYSSMSKAALERSKDFSVDKFQKSILDVLESKNGL